MSKEIILHPSFVRVYRKRIRGNTRLAKRIQERVELFRLNSQNPILRDHALIGEMNTYRSFSVTGDYRIIYMIEGDIVTFIDIGTHTQVY